MLHPFVAATLQAAETRRADSSGRIRITPTAGLIPLSVSRRELRRAMQVLHTLFRLAETRGHQIVPSESDWSMFRGVAIAIRSHQYPVRISELTSSIPMSEAECERWRRDNPWHTGREPTRKHVPNGKLQLSFPSFEESRKSWSEGPRGTLDSKLIRILDELEARADRDDLRDLERERAERERQRLLQERLERERLQRIEEQRSRRLSAEVQAWRRADEVKEYVAALRKRAVELARGKACADRGLVRLGRAVGRGFRSVVEHRNDSRARR